MKKQYFNKRLSTYHLSLGNLKKRPLVTFMHASELQRKRSCRSDHEGTQALPIIATNTVYLVQSDLDKREGLKTVQSCPHRGKSPIPNSNRVQKEGRTHRRTSRIRRNLAYQVSRLSRSDCTSAKLITLPLSEPSNLGQHFPGVARNIAAQISLL